MSALRNHLAGAVPSDLEKHFKFFEDDPDGDRVRYHVYCYYREAGPGGSAGKYHREWFISGTETAVGPDAEALAVERREVNIDLLRRDIVDKLRAENACLLEQGGVLLKAPAVPRAD